MESFAIIARVIFVRQFSQEMTFSLSWAPIMPTTLSTRALIVPEVAPRCRRMTRLHGKLLISDLTSQFSREQPIAANRINHIYRMSELSTHLSPFFQAIWDCIQIVCKLDMATTSSIRANKPHHAPSSRLTSQELRQSVKTAPEIP